MAGIVHAVQHYFGGAKSSVSSVASDIDADFADFATAASPIAPSHAASQAFDAAAATASAAAPANPFAGSLTSAGRPYTKWYRVWERVTLADFYQELFIIPCLLIVVLINIWGSRANRHRAKQWAANNLPLLESEFARIGFGGGRTSVKTEASGTSVMGATDVPEDMLREKSKGEYITYCTGRQNVAWLDIKLSLYPRYNPFSWLGQIIMSFFFDSMPAPVERMEATAYCFDGKEKSLVPAQQSPGGGITSQGNRDSSYDGFVWAVVHKDKMNQLRTDRYDLSLTTTKEHAKLPAWATVMSESAEVTEALLTPELIEAIAAAGEDLEALIVTDQPIDAPKKLNDTIPRKRLSLSLRLPSSPTSSPTRTGHTSAPLFALFLRLPDHLASTAHFRPEALRKVRATRDAEMAKIRRVDEEEKAEERKAAGDKAKKEERERKLARMSDAEQRKFLERERGVEQKRGMKKKTVKG